MNTDTLEEALVQREDITRQMREVRMKQQEFEGNLKNHLMDSKCDYLLNIDWRKMAWIVRRERGIVHHESK